MKIKRVFAICLASIMLACHAFFPTLAAYPLKVPSIGETVPKIEFAIAAKAEYEENLAEGRAIESTWDEQDSIIQTYSFASTLSEKNTLAEKMKTMGLYVYCDNSLAVMDDFIPPISAADGTPTENDVELHAPIIIYCADKDTWYVTASGHWKNDDWRADAKKGNLGRDEAFGFVFFDIAKDSYRSSVIRSLGVIWNQDFSVSSETANRGAGIGQVGVTFRLQDKILKNKHYDKNDPTDAKYDYLGYHWYAACVYDSNFATFSAAVTAYYMHTDDSASVWDIDYNTDNPREATFTLSGKVGGFFSYSAGDATTPGYPS